MDTGGSERLGEEASLDELLAALDLRPVDDDHFLVEPPSAGSLGRVFGGQLLAQAVVGAAATVTGKEIHSLHATFIRAGTPGAPLAVAVERTRDGRTMATRRVTLSEGERTLVVATASFAGLATIPDVAPALPAVEPPDETPTLQHWAADARGGRHWIESPPAVEMRLPEPPSFFDGSSARTPRSHWMRLPRGVGDDHARNAALLAYASDFFLMDMIFRAHPDELGPGAANGHSLDHVIWFHRPVRFDAWHLHTQEATAIVGDRGLARSTIHDVDGRCVASVAQEVLVMPGAP